MVTKIFFSPINVKALQDSIRYYVFQRSNNEISHQSDEQLYVIMRAIALQFGNFVTIDPVKEVKRLTMSIRDAIWIIGIFVALGATWGMTSQRINAMDRDIDRIEEALILFTKMEVLEKLV